MNARMKLPVIKALRWALWMNLCFAFGGICPAQGLVNFANLNAAFGVNAPIYDVDGKTPLGPGFFAQLYAGPVGSTSLQAVGSPVQFVKGYFFGGSVAVPGVAGGEIAVVQVRAWRALDGSTFETANHFGGHVGTSAVLTLSALGSSNVGVPAGLIGLESFSLYVVPEPPVWLLGVLGGVVFSVCRRRVRLSR
jgi:hypothetical protein